MLAAPRDAALPAGGFWVPPTILAGLGLTQEQVAMRGHAIEVRILAEDPRRNFLPSPGRVTDWHFATRPGSVRMDSAMHVGAMVPPYYDSMIGKLIVYGRTREGCIMRLKRALEEYVIEGMKTTIPLHQKLLRDPEFQNGDYTIKWLEEWLDREE